MSFDLTDLQSVAVAASLVSIPLVAILFAVRESGAFRRLLSFGMKHPLAVAFAVPAIICGATKVAVPTTQQCDYRIGSAVDVTDGTLGYYRMTGESMPTNIEVACCGGAVTNELTFTRTGQFYIETHQYSAPDFSVNPFWVRDSETNDWTRAVADQYHTAMSGATFAQGWAAEIAHLPDYADPKGCRYWFVGSEDNLPEKVIEGGIGIEVDFYFRDAHHILLRFHSNDPELAGATFVLQVRRVIDGDILGDWQTLATTTNGEFNVQGNFVQEYNRLRIYADKGGAE